MNLQTPNKPLQVSADEDLTMSKLPLKKLFDGAADAIIVEDPSENILYVNERACSLFGYSQAELLSMKTSDLEAAEIPIIPSHVIYSMDQDEVQDAFTTILRKKDGTVFPVEISMSRVSDRFGAYICSIIRDVGLQDRINRHYQETSLLYQKLVEDSLHGIAIMFLSPVSFAFINYPLAAIIGQPVKTLTKLAENEIMSIVHKEDLAAIRRIIRDLASGRDKAVGECRVVRPDGSVRWVEFFCCRIQFEKKPAVQMICVDTTDSKETKIRLEQTRDQLQALLEAIPGAASWINSDLIYLGMNSKLADLFKKPPSFFIGKKVGFLHTENEFSRFVTGFFQSDRESGSEEVIVNLPGRKITYLAVGQKYDQGKSAVFVAIDISERKQIEAELRRSEERFKRLVEHNPGAIIVHCKGIIVYANAASLKIVGARTESDVIGKPVFDFVHPDFRKVVTDRIITTQKNGMVASPIEEKFLTLDGRVIDVEVTAIPTLFNEDPATQVLFWDITERKKNLESLRKSEALSKAIIEGSPTGVSVREPTGRLISVNEAWKKLWKIPVNDVREDMEKHREELKFDHRDDYLKPYQDEVRRVYERGGSLQIPEIKIKGIRKSPTKWISQYFYALTDRAGKVEQVVILTADITARKEAAEDLARKDRILESISDAASVLLNTNELLLGLDEALACLGQGAGVSRVYVFRNSTDVGDRLLTSQIAEWVAEGVEPQRNNPDVQNIPLMESGYGRWIEILGGGEVIHGLVDDLPESEQPFLQQQQILSILVVPIFAENRWWGFIGFDHCTEKQLWTHSEIGALKSAAGIIGSTIVRTLREQEIQKINEELEQRIAGRTKDLQLTNQALAESLQTLRKTYSQLIQSEKMAALGNLVAGIAHEIKTPVGIGVTAASHLLEKSEEIIKHHQKNDPVDLVSYLQKSSESARIILTNLQRASDLIQSFKQVAVDQTSELKRVFYLKEYLGSIILSLKPELKKVDNLIINIDCPDSLHIHGYPGVYSQVFSNLILNSVIHGFENRQTGSIRIAIRKTDTHLIIMHEDNGSGILPEHLNSIFEPFFTTKRTRGGTGLGLNLVYNLITKNLKGTIRCESEPGEFTRFIIELPLYPESTT